MVNGAREALIALQRRKLIEEQIEETRAGVMRVVKLTESEKRPALADVDP